MAKIATRDVFAQFMRMSVTCTAANTLSFARVVLGTVLFEYAALILHRIEYDISADARGEMTADGDNITVAITGSDTIGTLQSDQPEVYDFVIITQHDYGVAAVGDVSLKPIVHDFTTMPGGGMMVPFQDIYIGLNSTGLASAATARLRAWWTIKELGPQDFLELVQRLRVLST
jgi:hypothetical protein